MKPDTIDFRIELQACMVLRAGIGIVEYVVMALTYARCQLLNSLLSLITQLLRLDNIVSAKRLNCD